MIDRLLAYLRNKGRMWALVDFYGDVQMIRAFPLFYESHNPTGWRALLPNLFIHLFPGEPGGQGPDGVNPHSHPWNSLSFVARKGYLDELDYGFTRMCFAPCLTYTSHRSFHRIDLVTPGTVTFFAHGFRKRKDWLMSREGNVMPFRANIDEDKVKHRSVMVWVKMDEQFEANIARRKKALSKLGPLPKTNEQKKALAKEHL